MYYFIYETKNKINGKLYRGCHKTETLNDGYIGSGLAIRRAIKKYGRDAFDMHIICFCEDLEDMILKEAQYVNRDWVEREDTYNLQTGGLQYGILGTESKKKISNTIKALHKDGVYRKSKRIYTSLSEETKQKISQKLKERYTKVPHHTIGSTPWNKGTKGLQQAWNKGMGKPKPPKMPRTSWNKNKKMPKTPCVYCGKEVSLMNLKKWHNEKCRNRPTKESQYAQQ